MNEQNTKELNQLVQESNNIKSDYLLKEELLEYNQLLI
jgi:hypothetical protein